MRQSRVFKPDQKACHVYGSGVLAEDCAEPCKMIFLSFGMFESQLRGSGERSKNTYINPISHIIAPAKAFINLLTKSP